LQLPGEAEEAEENGVATLCLVWNVDRPPGAAQYGVLSSDEKARAAAFTSDGARRRFVWMRAGLRCLLGERLGVSPCAIRFSYGEKGKPSLAAPTAARGLEFSVTHSGDVGAILFRVACAGEAGGVTPSPVGVDVERHRPRRYRALASRFFTLEDCAALDAEGDDAKSRLFFEMWTKKEAWLKAIGVGIGGGLDALSCGSQDSAHAYLAAAEDDVPPRPYLVSSLSGVLPGLDGYSLAVALPRGTRLRFETLSRVGWPHLLRCTGASNWRCTSHEVALD